MSLLRNVLCAWNYPKIVCHITRTVKTKKVVPSVIPLHHRSIIEITGTQSIDFLQGILTNDVTLLPKNKCMYAMMLNKEGRVMHDIMLYWPEQQKENDILLECHTDSLETILKSLNMYKLRKKVKCLPKEEFKLWQVQKHSIITTSEEANDNLENSLKLVDLNPLFLDKIALKSPDPRLCWLGWRVIANSQPCPDNFLGKVNNYHNLRYTFGIPEGPKDLLPGKGLPLESNLDFMNGISFDKGCYIGQELTARTYHTGVVRKRLVPILIGGNQVVEDGASLFDAKGSSVGKVRSTNDEMYGLALIKLSRQTISLYTLKGGRISVGKTDWWPAL